VDRIAVAAALREIAGLLEARGGQPFRVRAYERGARALEALNADLGELARAGRLTELPGVGAALAATITELLETGRSGYLEKLRAELPAGVLELRQVPHLSLRRIAALQAALGVDSVAALKEACVAGRVRTVKGFGPKVEQALLDGIRAVESRGHALLIHEAERDGEMLLAFVRSLRGVRTAALTGALRRRLELVETLDVAIAVAPRQESAVIEQLVRFPPAVAVVERTAHRCVLRLVDGGLVRAELTVPSRFPVLLLRSTGAVAHVAHLERLARERGLALDERGLHSRRGRRVAAKDEADLYRALGLPFLPPELREDAGEIEAALAGTLELDLVRESDVRGMVHCHTLHSDGKATIEEMARAADAMGMEYLTITDHSPTAHYAHGVTLDRLKAQWDEIARVQESVRVRLLRGTESDIRPDGSLDYPDEVLAQMDVIIASIHERHRMDSKQMTRRIVTALRHPFFKIWGHALGRYVRSRPPIECDLDEVFDAAAESRVAIEVNGDPHRLDLEPRWQREARKRRIPFVISTDAHSTGQMRNLRFGIAMARRGGLTPKDVLNTRTAAQFRALVRPA
jgi:DNA polymerase (family 10)